jgi:hypothetical protein
VQNVLRGTQRVPTGSKPGSQSIAILRFVGGHGCPSTEYCNENAPVWLRVFDTPKADAVADLTIGTTIWLACGTKLSSARDAPALGGTSKRI